MIHVIIFINIIKCCAFLYVCFPSARFRHRYYYAVTKRNTDPVIRHNAYDDYRYEKRQNSLIVSVIIYKMP